MKVVDANVLIYAVNSDAPHHEAAKTWLDSALRGPEPVGFAWIALLAFLRLTTRAALFPNPLDLGQAMSVMRGWLSQPAAVLVEPTDRHVNMLERLLEPLGTAGNLVSDAHIAALAIERSAVVISFDSDFGRFDGCRWEPPPSM